MRKFVIGKGENGKKVDIVVPQGHSYVSRFHAQLMVGDDGTVMIEDLDSTNGTFVNGQRVISKKLLAGDMVMLGSTGGGGYLFEWQRVIDSGVGSRVDYTNEFLKLEKLYAEYTEKLEKIKQKARRRQMLPRLIVTLVFGGLGIVLMFLEYPLFSGIPMLAGVLAQLIPVKSNKANDEIMDLKVRYSKSYKCPNPNCNKPYLLDSSASHPKMLRANKVCPFNCGAVFIKD